MIQQGRDTYPFFPFFQFYSVVNRDSKVDNFASSLFFFFLLLLLIIIRSGLLVEIWLSICMSKSQRNLCVSFSRTDTGLCKYHLLVWSNLNFLHISHWITLPKQSCIIIIIIIRVFYISVSWWSFIGD